MVTTRAARSPLTYLGGLVVAYLALPLIAFVVRFATSSQRGFHEAGLFPALWVSVSCATIALVIVTVFGVPLAFVLARSKGRVSSVVGVVVQIPLALPPLMSGIILIYIVGPYTTLGRFFNQQLTNSTTGIVIAMSFVAAPFLIVTARSAFAAMDAGLLDVATTLGHSELSRFLRVAVPVAGGGIRAGMLLTWLRAFGEYGAVVVLAYNPTSLPIYTYNQFSGVGLPTTLAPTALAVLVAIVAVGVSRVRIARRRPRRTVASRSSEPPVVGSEPFHFDVHHRLGTFQLAVRLDEPARHVAVLGPSGAGKSAMLRSLAGLNGPKAGDLWCGDTAQRDVPIERRHVGYLSQGFALFPHLTVWQQLLFAKNATPTSAAHWIDALGLDGLEDRLPHQISGGQRQRVALAQALCHEPHVLLLDEPFSSLDVPVRRELRQVLRRLQRESGLTTVLVTHDPEEAAFLSEVMIVIRDGHALQTGSVRDIFTQPASNDVAQLLGVANVTDGVISTPGELVVGTERVYVATGDLAAGARVSWSVRPEDVTLVARGDASPFESRVVSRLAGTISDVIDMGSSVEIVTRVAGEREMTVRVHRQGTIDVGDACDLLIPADRVAVWPASTTGS